jgi:vanillate O-demethylase monooxygenase subunit
MIKKANTQTETGRNMPFLRNTWYVGAFASEIGDQLLSRRICNELIAFWCRSDGTVAAVEDRCPHRFVRLSDGTKEGDEVRCRYHGLKFDGSGACTERPFEKDAPLSQIKVKSYPVTEREGAIWIWMGDHDKADPELVPHFFFVGHPDYVNIEGYLKIKGNYELITDNLLDLSHVQFLHPLASAQGSDISTWTTSVTQEGDTIWSWLWRPGLKPPAFQRHMWGSDSEFVDGQGHCRWNAPSILFADTAVTEVGKTPDEGLRVPSAHLLTPETETSTHYFWYSARNKRIDDRDLDKTIYDTVQNIFLTQDGPMIEAQQEAMGDSTDFFAHKPLILKPDAAGVRARRLLRKMIREEQGLFGEDAAVAAE